VGLCLTLQSLGQTIETGILSTYPAPRHNHNSFEGLTHQTTCPTGNTLNLIDKYWWQTLLQSRRQYQVIKDQLHPLVVSPPLNDLAFNHSLYDMGERNSVNSIGYLQRRQIILANAQQWFTDLSISPDPRYPPLGVVDIAELYGAGNNPSAAFKYILDYGKDIISDPRYNWIGVGVYCQPLPDQSFGDNNAAYWWVTLILVQTCFSPNEFAGSGSIPFLDLGSDSYNYFCCDVSGLQDYASCFAPNQTGTTYFVNTTNGVEPIACEFIPLNGANSVPGPVVTSYTGLAIATIFEGPGHQEVCFCVSHDIPTESNPNPADPSQTVTSVEIHFGKPGQQTENVPLFNFPEQDYEKPSFNDCWNYDSSGLCLENFLSNSLYIDIHNGQYSPVIRGQFGNSGINNIPPSPTPSPNP